MSVAAVAGLTSFDYYSLGDSIRDELHNNLIIVDSIVGEMQLQTVPEFYILGGAAMVFYNLMDRLTLDIDIVNSLDMPLREKVDTFISDQASAVTILGSGCLGRMIPYAEYLQNIKVYLLAQEDIIITKLMSNRRKDIADLLDSKILTAANEQKVINVLEKEYPDYIADRFCAYLHRLMERKVRYFE